MTDNVNLSKVNAYAVEQSGDAARVRKVNTYVVEQSVPANLKKVNTYSVNQTEVTWLYQDEAAKKPVYREAPTGGIPYVDMSASSAELKIDVKTADTYTMILYKADETFTVSEHDFTAGTNTAPITEDFNQCIFIRGKDLHRYTISAIKEGMKQRAA